MGEKKQDSGYRKRLGEVLMAVAEAADRRPLHASGLWFHDDVRNNFYYGSYLFAAAADETVEVPFDREAARHKAEAVLMETVLLQNRLPGSRLYGHWPLNLDPSPREAQPHELPVELMGSLMVWFCKHYGSKLSAGLRVAFHSALGHIYRSGFFRKPVVDYGHHEAKYTAAKLIYGSLFADEELREDGRNSLSLTLKHLRAKGMPEYGALPWFWHWVQAFTCAWELEEDGAVKEELAQLLDYLWQERADFYLQGAWVGAHSRGWPHDLPGDGNVLHDYVQFGDFKRPAGLPRTEYAGFLFYEAPEQARQTALYRQTPSERKKLVYKVVPEDGGPKHPLHSYAYITEAYAVGGMWERVEEFDNEQLRWAFSLPVRSDGSVNRLYFFHPGAGYREGDPRHQSGYAEVLFHCNTVLSLFPIPQGEPGKVTGVLPLGDWMPEDRALFGECGGVYFAVYLSHAYEITERNGYLEVTAAGTPGGVAVEAVGIRDAAADGIVALSDFAAVMRLKGLRIASGDEPAVEYSTLSGETLLLVMPNSGGPAAYVNDRRVTLEDYTV